MKQPTRNGQVNGHTKFQPLQKKPVTKKKENNSVDVPENLGWITERNKNLSHWFNYELSSSDFDIELKAKHDSPGGIDLKLKKLRIVEEAKKILKKADAVFYHLNVNIMDGENYFKNKVNLIIDIGLRRSIVNILKQYNHVWLSLALEICFDKMDAFGNMVDDVAFNRVINESLFGNIPEDAQVIKVNQEFLLSCLKMIHLLDYAVNNELIIKQNKLFKDNTIKSSLNIFHQITNIFIEEELIEVIEESGLSLSYHQNFLKDFDYYVEDLATDLRDGIKLAKFVTQLLGRAPKDIIIPTKNFDEELSNMKNIFRILDFHGLKTKFILGGPTKPVDIVNGNREKTIGLLWTIMLKWMLPNLIDSTFLKKEIVQLKLQYFKCFQTKMPESITEITFFKSSLLSGLLTWCNSVCNLYHLEVNNFTSSFEDGQAICYLIAYYFPEVLSPVDIKCPPKSNDPEPEVGILESNWLVFSPPKKRKLSPIREAIIHNFDLFKSAINQLGNMPKFHSFRSYGNIDEKLVIIYIVYLANRIQYHMKLNDSAKKIQKWWNEYNVNNSMAKKLEMIEQMKSKAVKLIVDSYRRYKDSLVYKDNSKQFDALKCSSIVIQSLRKGKIDFEYYNLIKNASTVIQNSFNMYKVKQDFNFKKYNAIIIQKTWRRFIAIRTLNQLKLEQQAIVLIQSNFRSYKQRIDYNKVFKASCVIQNQFNNVQCMKLQKKKFNNYKLNCIKVQRFIRYVNEDRELRRIKNNAALTIQNAVRSYNAKKQLEYIKLINISANVIQNQLRMKSIRDHYVNGIKLANILQSTRKQVIEGNHVHSDFNKIKKYAFLFQQLFRFRNHMMLFNNQRNEAISKIQSVIRMKLVSKDYNDIKYQIQRVQYRRNIFLVGKSINEEYLKYKQSIVKIQAQMYRFMFKKQIEYQKNQAAVIIQAFCRRKLAMLLLDKLKLEYQSAIQIQSIIRMDQIKYKYLEMRNITAFIQMRRNNMIQSQQIYNEYNNKLNAAKLIQSKLRNYWYVKAENYKKLVASIKIQTMWRRFKAIQLLNHLRIQFDAVVLIQAKFKGYFIQTMYNRMINITKDIQFKIKDKKVTEDVNSKFIKLKSNAVFIQQRFRFLKYIENWKKQRNAACISIQNQWRSLILSRQFKQYQINQRAITISSVMKTNLILNQYNKLKQNSILCKQIYTTFHQAKQDYIDFNSIKLAATFVQYRHHFIQLGKAVKNEFWKYKQATIIIQTYWRKYQARKLLHDLHINHKATLIQSAIRMKKQKEQFNKVKFNINNIIKIYKNNLICNEIYDQYNESKLAANVIQYYRCNFILSELVHYQFLDEKEAVMIIQRALRAYWERKQLINASAIKIQSALRMKKISEDYNNKIKFSNLIRDSWKQAIRNKKIKYDFDQLKSTVDTIQKVRNNYLKCNNVRDDYITCKNMAIGVQSFYRMYLVNTNFEKAKSLANLIQFKIKDLLLTKQLNGEYNLIKDNVIKLQSIIKNQKRCNSIKYHYLKQVKAAKLIQNNIRSYWIEKDIKLKSTIALQAQIRMFLIRKQYLVDLNVYNKSIVIQAFFRMVKSKVQFNKTKQLSNLIIQRRQVLLDSNEILYQYDNFKLAATLIQVKFKGLVQFNEFNNRKQNIIKIQSLYRSWIMKKHNAAMVIQNAYKAYKLIQHAKQILQNKIEIRNRFKRVYLKLFCMRVLDSRFNLLFKAINYHQFNLISKHLIIWRNLCEHKLEEIRIRNLEIKKQQSAIKIQTISKAYLARQRLIEVKKLVNYLQPLFRAYKVRIKSHPKVQRICSRLIKINKLIEPHMILSNRTTAALKILNNSKSLTEIIKGCSHLVVVTQLSSNCRNRLMGEYNVITIILKLMKSCNRSQPHQEILKYSVMILENLSRDQSTAINLLSNSNQVDDILKTMLSHKDINHVINSLLVTLFNLIQYNQPKKIIMNTNNIKLSLNMVLNAIKRKSIFSNKFQMINKIWDNKYSIGLTGLSSNEVADQIELIRMIIEQV